VVSVVADAFIYYDGVVCSGGLVVWRCGAFPDEGTAGGAMWR
jgi:hypothetical protein